MAFDFLVQLLVNGFIIGSLYGVVAMSFVLIYKSSQVVNFAQGEFLLVGAWACWWLLAKFSMPFYMAFLLTLLFMMLFWDFSSNYNFKTVNRRAYNFYNNGHYWLINFFSSYYELDVRSLYRAFSTNF